jgi:hypothetical protein
MWLVDLCPSVDESHWKISGHYALLVINGKLSLTDKWSAGCAEMRKSGSVRRVEKRAALCENQSWSQLIQRALLLLYRRNALWAKPCCNAPSADISFADQSI